ncbi:MAG: V4R domain-containing protein [Sumerlaeia bacterium]
MSKISIEAGGSLHGIRHNYYDPEDFFLRDERTGEIRRRDGQRTIAISEDFVAALMAGTAEEVGDEAARAIMYQAGFQWALADMKNFSRNMEKEFGSIGLTEMQLNFVLETWWWPLTSQGWGGWKFDFAHRKQGLIFVDLYDSVVARSLERLGKPVCYWYAGLFGGLFTFMSRRDLSSIEIQCYANGYDVCKFMVGMEKRVNAAAFWVEEGATSKEIMSQLLE